MNTDIAKKTVTPVSSGWIFYDANCRWCRLGRRRTGDLFSSRGFVWVPLQTPGSARRLGVPSADFDRHLHLLEVDGRVRTNADALAFLCRSVGWLRPLGTLLAVPGIRTLARWAYDFVARHRYRGTGNGWHHRVETAAFEKETP